MGKWTLPRIHSSDSWEHFSIKSEKNEHMIVSSLPSKMPSRMEKSFLHPEIEGSMIFSGIFVQVFRGNARELWIVVNYYNLIIREPEHSKTQKSVYTTGHILSSLLSQGIRVIASWVVSIKLRQLLSVSADMRTKSPSLIQRTIPSEIARTSRNIWTSSDFMMQKLGRKCSSFSEMVRIVPTCDSMYPRALRSRALPSEWMSSTSQKQPYSPGSSRLQWVPVPRRRYAMWLIFLDVQKVMNTSHGIASQGFSIQRWRVNRR